MAISVFRSSRWYDSSKLQAVVRKLADAANDLNAFKDVFATDDITAATSNNAFVTHAQTYTIPNNLRLGGSLSIGDRVRISAMVRATLVTAVVPTLQCQLRLGGTPLVVSTAVAPTAGTVIDHVHLEADFICRGTPGAAVSCVATGWWGTNMNGTVAPGTSIIVPTNFNTAGALVVDVQTKWSTNAASNNARLEMLNVEVFRANPGV